VPTPKIENLLRKHHPTMVIVQLGTNHFDNVVREGRAALPKQEDIFERFARAILKTTGEVQQVVWILPPDSAHFSNAVQSAIADTIRKVADRHNFIVIDSRRMTHYVTGKTGGDGIHYNSEAGLEWAASAVREINRSLLPRVRVNGKST
jgi:lysophospholipase L1-like esterase